MKMSELVEGITAGNERAFKQVSEVQAKRIVAAVLRDIAARIDSAEDGTVSVPGLGRFVVKHVAKADGETVKRISFRAAKPGKGKTAEG
jgi:nucleoid DNA-binding protein